MSMRRRVTMVLLTTALLIAVVVPPAVSNPVPNYANVKYLASGSCMRLHLDVSPDPLLDWLMCTGTSMMDYLL